MARGDQLGRQWKIIQTLISSRKGKSASELARELECRPRTLYRDLEALQVAGFPIYTERSERKNLWSVLDTVKNQIPIPFTLTELMALHFSRDMLKVFKDTAFFESLESLLQKVKTTLPKDSIEYLKSVEQALHLSMKPYKDYGRFKEIINRVMDASVNRKTIEIVYFTMSRKRETRRRIDPYRVWFFNREKGDRSIVIPPAIHSGPRPLAVSPMAVYPSFRRGAWIEAHRWPRRWGWPWCAGRIPPQYHPFQRKG